MTDTLVWQDPPPSARGKRYDEILEQLRAHPDRWALVLTDQSRTAASSAARTLKQYGCEATTRHIDDGVNVYARFIGDAS